MDPNVTSPQQTDQQPVVQPQVQPPVNQQAQPAQPAQQTVTIGGKETGPITISQPRGEVKAPVLSEVGPQAPVDIPDAVEEAGVKETVPHQPVVHPAAQALVTPGPDAAVLDTNLTGEIPHDFKVLLEEPEQTFYAQYKKEHNTQSPMYWILHVAKKLRDRFKQQKQSIH